MVPSSPSKDSLSVPRWRDAVPSTPGARPSCFSIWPSSRGNGHAVAIADPSSGVLGRAASESRSLAPLALRLQEEAGVSGHQFRLNVFFAVATCAWAAAHWYVGKRLIVPWRATGAQKRRGYVLLAAAFLLAPTVMVAGRTLVDRSFFGPFRWFAFLEMGTFLLLFLFLVFRDVVLFLGGGMSRLMRRDPDPERRRFLENVSNTGILGATGLLAGWGFAEAQRLPEVVEVDVPIEGLPFELEGYRIAQLSDIHVGPTIRRDDLAARVAIANGLEPDLIAITGDLVDGYVEDMRDDVAPLADLWAPDGVFFCTGNHEYYWDANAWVVEVARLGLRVLLNEHVLVERGEARLLVAGCTDYSAHRVMPEAKSDPVQAKRGAPPHDVSLLLAHQPKSIFEAAGAGFDLQLSGHTHGGQFFPINLIVGLVHPFAQGLGKLRDTWIYVNRGTGYWGPRCARVCRPRSLCYV